MKPLLNKTNYKEKLYEKVGNEYYFREPYTKGKMKLIHNKCGKPFDMSPSDFLTRGRRCPNCAHGHKRKSNEEFLKEVKEQVGDEYTFLEEYITKDIHIKVRHNVCGKTYSTTPDNFLNHKRRCPKCANNEKLTKEEIDKLILENLGNEYVYVEEIEYINNKNGIPVLHKKCGEISYKTPSNIRKKCECKYCSDIYNSKGVKLIESFLIKNNIKFEKEYKLEGCFVYGIKNPERKYYMPLDFYIPDFNTAIEFDGEGHYKESFTSNTEDAKKSLERRKENDILKNKKCKENGIHILRIGYKLEDKIPEILENIFLKESSTTIENNEYFYYE